MIISIKKLLNKQTKMPETILQKSARQMLGTTHNPLNLYRIDGVTDRIRGKKETYIVHLVPKCSKTIQYFSYIFKIINPNPELIKQYFVSALAVHPDVAKAHDYNIEKTVNNDIEIELKSGQFVLSIPKSYIKKLHLLSPLATSQEYILFCFNSALHNSLKSDAKLKNIPLQPK
tara:strand:- start:47 stop:568 length:522 start_codon:yes stop_codon:yes gene_type:complete